MTLSKILTISALSAILFANEASALLASDFAPMTMKPLQGISFDLGTKRAVSYFLKDQDQCKLVLTYAAAPDWKAIPSLTATRFEARIPAGQSTRFDASEGPSVEFFCHTDARAVTVKQSEHIAVDATR